MYDYLVVGSGLFGATFARIMTDAGKRCLVIDKRSHIGGNVYSTDIDGIHVHMYGPHIFHTSNDDIWEFVNRFTQFNNYVHRVKAINEGKYYTLPFNLKTFNEVAGVMSIERLKEFLETRERDDTNLERCAISLVGEEVYETLIKGYTEKQWGRRAKDLPADIIKRLPVRNNFEDNYFNDKYQGIPVNGYTKMVENMLEEIEVKINTSYDDSEMKSLAKKIVYTGPIDQFFNYALGRLEYRSLDFVVESYQDIDYYQGCAQINYTNKEVPFTRSIEHRHFYPDLKVKGTIVTKEYPADNGEPFYPIGDEKNKMLYLEYKDMASQKRPEIIFGGRLGNYQYYDMHQVIGQAMKYAKLEKERNTNN
jgi:UDP-galactopyranose mutase